MARYDNEWDRDRERRDRGYDERNRAEGQGWGQRGWEGGGQHSGPGYGSDRGYGGRESSGGGMGSYMGNQGSQRSEFQGQYGYGSQGYGSERGPGGYRTGEGWNRGEEGYSGSERGGNYGPSGYSTDRDREQYGSENFGGREGGWGGYGSYDRQRGGSYDRERHGRESGEFNRQGAWSGNTGSVQRGQGQGSSWPDQNNWGRFSGRGPKNYKRSDDRITEDINERLTQHPEIDAWEIEIEVKNGEVTLRGTVDDRRAKRAAEDIAEQVSGVHQVHNQIRVEQQGAGNAQGSNRGAGQTGSQSSSAQRQQGEMTGSKK